MKKNPATHFGFSNARLSLAATLAAGGALLAMFSFASNPATSTITVPPPPARPSP